MKIRSLMAPHNRLLLKSFFTFCTHTMPKYDICKTNSSTKEQQSNKAIATDN